jgi:hypothetical protein
VIFIEFKISYFPGIVLAGENPRPALLPARREGATGNTR